jgi:hypothetical protein
LSRGALGLIATTEMSATTRMLAGRYISSGDTRILREGGSPHVMENVLAPSTETSRAVRHQSLALSRADLAAQVGLATLPTSQFTSPTTGGGGKHLAELALSALRGVERDDVVANLDVGDTLADRLDDSAALVSADNGEGTLGILARECVCIGVAHLWRSQQRERIAIGRTPVQRMWMRTSCAFGGATSTSSTDSLAPASHAIAACPAISPEHPVTRSIPCR